MVPSRKLTAKARPWKLMVGIRSFPNYLGPGLFSGAFAVSFRLATFPRVLHLFIAPPIRSRWPFVQEGNTVPLRVAVWCALRTLGWCPWIPWLWMVPGSVNSCFNRLPLIGGITVIYNHPIGRKYTTYIEVTFERCIPWIWWCFCVCVCVFFGGDFGGKNVGERRWWFLFV